MFNQSTYSLWRAYLLAICLFCFCGCFQHAKQFYARDVSSGLLLGPFEMKNGTFVETGAGGFCITEPNPGELEVMDRLRLIVLDVYFNGQTLQQVVDALIVKQKEAVGSNSAVKISLQIDKEWYELHKEPASVPGREDVEMKEIILALPTVSFAANHVSLIDVLRLIQQSVKCPLILKISQDGVVLWLRFVPREV